MRIGVDIALAPVASPQPAGNTSPTMPLRVVCTVSTAILLLVEPTPASDVVDLAASLIGRPYVWGAEGPNTSRLEPLRRRKVGRKRRAKYRGEPRTAPFRRSS